MHGRAATRIGSLRFGKSWYFAHYTPEVAISIAEINRKDVIICHFEHSEQSSFGALSSLRSLRCASQMYFADVLHRIYDYFGCFGRGFPQNNRLSFKYYSPGT